MKTGIELIAEERAGHADQRSVAMTYALAIRSNYPTDWKRVNVAIIERWGERGLNRIKNMAWSGRCFEGVNGR